MLYKSMQLYKNAFGGLPTPVWWLALVMFVNRSGTMVLPFLTLYLTQQLHYSIAEAGIVMAFYGSGALLGTFLGGKLADKIGFYHVQLYSLLGSGLVLLVLMSLSSFYAICTGVFIFTTLGDTFRPANGVAIAYYTDAQNRTRSYSLNRLAINLGWSIGGGLGGILAEIDYHWLFWGDGITCIVAAILLRIFVQPPKHNTSTHLASSTQQPKASQSAFRDRLFLFFMGLVVLYAIPFFQLFTLEPLYFRSILHLSESSIGVLMVFNGLLIVFTEMLFVHQADGYMSKYLVMAGGLFLTAGSFIVLNLGTAMPLVWLSIALHTVGEIGAMPFMQTFVVSRSSEANRGEYLALYSMCYSIAQITAPSIGAIIVQAASFQALWYFMTSLCLISMLGFLYLYKKYA